MLLFGPNGTEALSTDDAGAKIIMQQPSTAGQSTISVAATTTTLFDSPAERTPRSVITNRSAAHPPDGPGIGAQHRLMMAVPSMTPRATACRWRACLPKAALYCGPGRGKRQGGSYQARRRVAPGSKPRPDGLLWATARGLRQRRPGLDLLKMSMPVRTRLLDICWTSNQVIKISY
jgi:hypothetical protein